MTDRFIKNVNLAILFVALSATAILAFLRTLLVDRVIFVMLMISATVAVSTVISLVFFLKFNTKRQKTVMLVSTAVMALSGFIVDFILDWKLCPEMFTIHHDFAYPTLTAVICGLVTLLKLLMTLKADRTNKEIVLNNIACENIEKDQLEVRKIENITNSIINMRHERHILQDEITYSDIERDPVESFKNDLSDKSLYGVYYNDDIVGYLLCNEEQNIIHINECYISETVSPHWFEMYTVLKIFFDDYKKTIDLLLPLKDNDVRQCMEIVLTKCSDEFYFEKREDGDHLIVGAM